MTQEERQLRLITLCAMLPHGIKGRVYAETTTGEYDISGDLIFFDSPFDVILDGINTSTEEIHVIAIGNEDTVNFIEDQQIDGKPYTIDDFKPYLRPMSNMTEEDLRNFAQLKFKNNEIWEIVDFPKMKFGFRGFINVDCKNKHSGDIWTFQISRNSPLENYLGIDWLNKKGFDYRGLIPMGLALKAKEGMYI